MRCGYCVAKNFPLGRGTKHVRTRSPLVHDFLAVLRSKHPEILHPSRDRVPVPLGRKEKEESERDWSSLELE